MKQTAMQQHIAWLFEHQLTLDIPMEVIEDAEYRLEVEKQQIIDATNTLLYRGTGPADDAAEQYYNETYQK